VQELRAGDLAQADGGDVDGVAPKALFISSYTRCGLIGVSVEVRLAQHQRLRSAQRRPSRRGPSACRRPSLARHLDEQLASAALASTDDAVVGREDAADLRGLDVHVHELAALAVDLGAEPVWRLAQRLPMPSTKSLASMVALP
jgi:hypothetical protein